MNRLLIVPLLATAACTRTNHDWYVETQIEKFFIVVAGTEYDHSWEIELTPSPEAVPPDGWEDETCTVSVAGQIVADLTMDLCWFRTIVNAAVGRT